MKCSVLLVEIELSATIIAAAARARVEMSDFVGTILRALQSVAVIANPIALFGRLSATNRIG
nr:hypothetical protein [Mesorhizobium loti]